MGIELSTKEMRRGILQVCCVMDEHTSPGRLENQEKDDMNLQE